MTPESAFDRVIRNLVIAIGVGSLVFTALGLPAIIEQHPYLNPVFSLTAVVVYCGLPPILAVLAMVVPVAELRVISGVHAASGLIFLGFWMWGMTATQLPHSDVPWLINLITVAACMSVIALPPTAAWIYLAFAAVGVGVVQYLAYGGGDGSFAFQSSVMMIVFSSVLMALLQLALRAAREQDAAALVAQHAAAATAAAEMRERQRARYQAFTHDDVLATLLSASRNSPGTLEATRHSAAAALRKLDEFSRDAPARARLTAFELDALLRAASPRADIPFEVTWQDGAHDLVIPVDVGDSLAAATTEALRNSLRHAAWPDERPIERTVKVTLSASRVYLRITDNGKGFIPSKVDADRLGVRVSILGRVNSLPGARATVRSTRGGGTRVRLSWSVGGVHGGN